MKGIRTMKKVKVLLVCGSGASSGFMATNMRKSSALRNIELEVIARGESEIENYIDSIDVLMIGPHLSYIMDEIEEYINGYENVVAILMKPSYYSTLNGEDALNHMLEEITK